MKIFTLHNVFYSALYNIYGIYNVHRAAEISSVV